MRHYTGMAGLPAFASKQLRSFVKEKLILPLENEILVTIGATRSTFAKL